MALQFSLDMLLTAKTFFAQNPNGMVRFINGFEYIWTKQEFYAWFRQCLLLKCGGKKYTEKELNKIRDGRIINEYFGKRIRRSGRNILTDPKMKKKYPDIDNPQWDE
jgi:hypothetical protein